MEKTSNWIETPKEDEEIMKKKQILAMGLSAVLACTSLPAAFAADENPQTPAAEQPAATDAVAETQTASFRLGSMATVSEVMLETSGVYSYLLVETDDDQQIRLNLSDNTLVVDNETGLPANLTDIQVGDRIFAYYSAAMTRSLPPQSACELILVNVGDNTPASLHEVGSVSEADGVTSVLTADGSMIVRMDDQTSFSPLATKNIVTVQDLTPGTRFLAWYDIVALSYPGQTYTQKVVILPEISTEETAETAETEDAATAEALPRSEASDAQAETDALTIVADGQILDVTGETREGVAVLPVRAVAEALGCTVSYAQRDGKEYVTVENDTRAMTLEIGTDNYISTSKIEDAVGMTAPAQYGVAPYIVDGTTYAAADLFESLVGFDVTTADGTITIAAQA